MVAIVAFLLSLLGFASPVLAGGADVTGMPVASCDLSLARVGAVLPANLEASPVVRIVRPGEAVTQEFAPGRTTIVLDAEGRVVAVRCG